eukprot:CAMPEP_0183519678 /NCGR_PEP_ID=MMETSP0371-20130417/16303_1 /TAXON_ID=268820 /ORGANISM="Peridinium aciculiferum, Strain PAER-2" /LENGTH=112 /DNA_ID=CAMNT_0025717865 /DNA_START=61 /DNA_END=399 /DNA_ORIENTATION=+
MPLVAVPLLARAPLRVPSAQKTSGGEQPPAPSRSRSERVRRNRDLLPLAAATAAHGIFSIAPPLWIGGRNDGLPGERSAAGRERSAASGVGGDSDEDGGGRRAMSCLWEELR